MSDADVRNIRNRLILLADKEYHSNGNTEVFKQLKSTIEEINKTL